MAKNLNIGGKSLKNTGVGISGSAFFDQKNKFVGSHHGTISAGSLSDAFTEYKNPELVKLQQNCKTPNSVLEPKACEVIKDVDPKKVQLVMIASPFADNPFVTK